MTESLHSFQSIWDHLVEITKFGRATVIITTHYIDETRQAHQIGLMRGGKLLAEESPTDLLRKYNADSLEDVFLKLSVLQNMGKRRRSSIAKEVIEAVQLPAMTVSVNFRHLHLTLSLVISQNPALDLSHDDDNGEISGEFGDNVSMSSRGPEITSLEVHAPPLPPDDDIQDSCLDYLPDIKSNHMKALIWKNFLWMWRNFG